LLVIDRLRQATRDARNSSAAIILVLASVISACAAVVGLTSGVTVAAAVAAVLSGGKVLWNELFVPMRVRSAENAALRVISRDSQQTWRVGTAFQIAGNRWITAQHVIADSEEILLKIHGGDSAAQVLYQNPDIDIAVLSVGGEWAWRASLARSLPGSGDQVKAVGWAQAGGDQWRRITLDYLVQGPGQQVKASTIALTGANHPQIGFFGAPVINMGSGQVVGVLNRFSRGPGSSRYRDEGLPSPDPFAVTFVTPISEIPAEYR
jgi:hypothetical protein